MERLTVRTTEPVTMSMGFTSTNECKLYRRLAELENAIENGTLVELPCKVGDVVYYTDKALAKRNRWKEFIVDEIRYSKNSYKVWFLGNSYVYASDFKKYIRTTREEIEKLIEELRK